MIVIELEEKLYGKSMEAVSKIKQYAECLAEMFEEHTLDLGDGIGYRGGMSYRSGMGYRKHEDENYEPYSRMPRKHRDDYRGDYGERYM